MGNILTGRCEVQGRKQVVIRNTYKKIQNTKYILTPFRNCRHISALINKIGKNWIYLSTGNPFYKIFLLEKICPEKVLSLTYHEG
jgi:hypothetical protein